MRKEMMTLLLMMGLVAATSSDASSSSAARRSALSAESETCPGTMFRCSSGKQCINRAWLCDGREDCRGGEDETYFSAGCRNPFLVVTNDIKTIIFTVDLTTTRADIIPVQGVAVYEPRAVAVDPVDHKLYWSDVSTRTINVAGLDGSDAQHLIEGIACFGLAVDAPRRLLIYTNYADRTVNKMSLDGGDSVIIVQAASGSGLATVRLDSKAGLIYWLEYYTDVIERVDYTGAGRQVVVSGEGALSGMAINDNTLCFCTIDGGYKLACVGRDGRNKRVIYEGPCSRVAISDTHAYIVSYWSSSLGCNIAVVELESLRSTLIDPEIDGCTYGNGGILFVEPATLPVPTPAVTSEQYSAPEATSQQQSTPETTSQQQSTPETTFQQQSNPETTSQQQSSLEPTSALITSPETTVHPTSPIDAKAARRPLVMIIVWGIRVLCAVSIVTAVSLIVYTIRLYRRSKNQKRTKKRRYRGRRSPWRDTSL